MNKKFKGFDQPLENWSKLPHAFVEVLPQFSSLAELKVVLYILRHTWGYQEFDALKTITVDEFANGRKWRDGTRIDNGIGMSDAIIRDGIKRAVEDNFILVQTDDTDKGRIQKSYQLNMKRDGVENLPPDSRKSTPWPEEIYPRSEKETSERNLGKVAPNGAKPFTGLSKTKSYSKWTHAEVKEFYQAQGEALDRLVEAWGYSITRYVDLTVAEAVQFARCYRSLETEGIKPEHYASLSTYTHARAGWKKDLAPEEMLKFVTAWRESRLTAPNITPLDDSHPPLNLSAWVSPEYKEGES